MEAIALGLEAIAIRLEAIALPPADEFMNPENCLWKTMFLYNAVVLRVHVNLQEGRATCFGDMN